MKFEKSSFNLLMSNFAILYFVNNTKAINTRNIGIVTLDPNSKISDQLKLIKGDNNHLLPTNVRSTPNNLPIGGPKGYNKDPNTKFNILGTTTHPNIIIKVKFTHCKK